MLTRNTSHIPRSKRFSFQPDFIVDTVQSIDFAALQKQGIVAALIDLDGTVVARSSYDVAEAITEHLAKQTIPIYIATNRPKSRSLKNLKQSLHASGVIHPDGIWGKPFPRYYAQAASSHGLDASQVVMIGDRFLQDIYGANAAGMMTIAVRKLDTPTNPIDWVLSTIERLYLQRLAGKYTATAA